MAVRSSCFFCVAFGGFRVATVDFGLRDTPLEKDQTVSSRGYEVPGEL